MNAEELFLNLKTLGVKITGSYARGEETKNSDLDFYVPEKKWNNVKQFLMFHFQCGSTAIGQLTIENVDGYKIEISWRFDRQARRLKTRAVNGVEFLTY